MKVWKLRYYVEESGEHQVFNITARKIETAMKIGAVLLRRKITDDENGWAKEQGRKASQKGIDRAVDSAWLQDAEMLCTLDA